MRTYRGFTRVERFWSHVNKGGQVPDCAPELGQCWEWTGYVMPSGYGRFTLGKHIHSAHRAAYKLLVGELIQGLVIDHLCRNKSCVNPMHLEQVTQLINIRRGLTGEINKSKTHCPHGHTYNASNTIYGPKMQRFCRACNKPRARLGMQKLYQKRKVEKLTASN